METLYIVGNGFDLHFNLKTKAEHFIEHLQKQPIYNGIGHSAFDVLVDYGINWCDYEQSLNGMDLDEIELQNEIGPDYLSDRESDRDGGIWNMQMYLESLNDAINSALKEMVSAANDEIRKLRLCRPPKCLFKSGDAILTFNYTSTIESLFCLPDDVPVFHIHGCYEDGDSLVFGYKRDENSYTDDWPSIDEEHWDYYIVQQRKAVYDFYKKWRKMPKIDDLKVFLAEYYRIDRVVVLGHSMSTVDSEYMEQIEKSLNPIRWEVSYFNEDDIKRVQTQGYSFQHKIKFEKMEVLLKG